MYRSWHITITNEYNIPTICIVWNFLYWVRIILSVVYSHTVWHFLTCCLFFLFLGSYGTWYGILPYCLVFSLLFIIPGVVNYNIVRYFLYCLSYLVWYITIFSGIFSIVWSYLLWYITILSGIFAIFDHTWCGILPYCLVFSLLFIILGFVYYHIVWYFLYCW